MNDFICRKMDRTAESPVLVLVKQMLFCGRLRTVDFITNRRQKVA